jgi:hypothetical protein
MSENSPQVLSLWVVAARRIERVDVPLEVLFGINSEHGEVAQKAPQKAATLCHFLADVGDNFSKFSLSVWWLSTVLFGTPAR